MEKKLLVLFALGIIAIVECEDLKNHRRKRGVTYQVNGRGEQCIDDLGCYSGVEGTMDNPDDAMDRGAIGTEFRWWAPGAQKARVITNQDFEVSGFDPGLKVKFIIHGWMAGDAEWALTMKDSFMRKEQCNVIIVDWTKGAEMSWYFTAVANTWVVGAELGHFIVQLVEATGLKVEDIHIVGHSLGAHTAGFAGKWVKNRLEKPVGRITGLDPAGPEFASSIPGKRLDSGDAAFVDVIHTNGADEMIWGVGLNEDVGHFDFYPNGGENQPGCENESDNSRWSFFAGYEDQLNKFICSHSRAIELFLESIESDSCKFMADQCSSLEAYQEGKCPPGKEGTLRVQMGYHADEYKEYIDEGEHKSFFLETNGEPPFCKRE